MAQDGEDFFKRWSRRKLAQTAPAPATPPEPALPELPPLDAVDFDSDFRAFMHAKVEEGVRRAALKKLFADPRFNVMDGLDTYIDDYTQCEPMTEELLASLQHARTTLFGPKKEEPQPAQEEGGTAQPAASDTQAPASEAHAGTPAAPTGVGVPAAQAKTEPDGAAG